MSAWPREHLEGESTQAPGLGLGLTEPWAPGQLAGAVQPSATGWVGAELGVHVAGPQPPHIGPAGPGPNLSTPPQPASPTWRVTPAGARAKRPEFTVLTRTKPPQRPCPPQPDNQRPSAFAHCRRDVVQQSWAGSPRTHKKALWDGGRIQRARAGQRWGAARRPLSEPARGGSWAGRLVKQRRRKRRDMERGRQVEVPRGSWDALQVPARGREQEPQHQRQLVPQAVTEQDSLAQKDLAWRERGAASRGCHGPQRPRALQQRWGCSW